MTVEEFAKYVINNLGRASLVNALNISEKLDNPKFYSVNSFILACVNYLLELQNSSKIIPKKCSRLLVALYNCEKNYNSEIKYNKKMVIDNLIIEMWEACNEKFN